MLFKQYNTTNQSFLDIHNYLKSKGIQNNDFFLALYDSSLSDIDPRDPNLSDDIKSKIIEECKNNIWYFLREIVLIPKHDGSEENVRFKLNKLNLALIYLYLNNIPSWLSSGKYSYKTMSVCTIIAYNSLSNNTYNDYSARNKRNLYESYCNNILELQPDYLKNQEFETNNLSHINFFDEANNIKDLEDKVRSAKTSNSINIFTSPESIKDINGTVEFLDKYSIIWDESFFDNLPNMNPENFVYIQYLFCKEDK